MSKLPRCVILSLLAFTAANAQENRTAGADQTGTQPDQTTTAKESPRPRLRFGGMMVGGSYSRGYAGWPWYGYSYGYGWWPGMLPVRYLAAYDPLWVGFPMHPGFYSGFGYQASMGKVELKALEREAGVYLDGAYAGPAHKLRNLWLDPGAYTLEVRPGQGAPFRQRIYVLTGKTLKVDATQTSDQDR